MSSSSEIAARAGLRGCDSSDEQCGESDTGGTASGARPGLAERKRQLERNRRNLINTRFLELGIELQRSENDDANANSQDARQAKKPRMDKEALLKEATMRLIVQHKELTSANARLKDLLAQIDSMRVEMNDLRKDKEYLRAELQRLHNSTKNIWKLMHELQSHTMSAMPDPLRQPGGMFGVSNRAESQVEQGGPMFAIGPGLNDSSAVAGAFADVQEEEAGNSDRQAPSQGPFNALNVDPQASNQGANMGVGRSFLHSAASMPSQNALQGDDPSTQMSILDDLGALFTNSNPARVSDTQTARAMTTGPNLPSSLQASEASSSLFLMSSPMTNNFTASSTTTNFM